MADENNTTKFLRGLLECAQELELAGRQVLLVRSIEDSQGTQLDRIGRIVVQPRNGLDDVTYRRYLRARVVANKSDGTIADVISVLRLILGNGNGTITFRNQGNAAFMATIEGIAVDDDLANILINFMNDTKLGGVRAIIESSAEPPSTWMRWDVDTWDSKVMMVARDEAR